MKPSVRPNYSRSARTLLALVVSFYSLGAIANVGEYHSPWDGPRYKPVFLGALANRYISKNHPSQQALSDIKTGRMAFTAGGRLESIGKSWDGIAEAEGGIGLKDDMYRYMEIPELHVSYHGIEHLTVSLGRKLDTWNRFEDFWALGMFQPRFRWDYLDVRTNGLTGLFSHIDSEYVQATAYWTPIFIPEQGTPFTFAGGKCASSSPWFPCPGSSISLFNQNTEIFYKLEIPPITHFINQPGYGGYMRLGKNRGAWIQGAYAKKALNQVMLAYEGYLNLATATLPATVHARPTKHELFSGETGYTTDRWALMFSGIWEKPIRDDPPYWWNTQEESESKTYGPTLYTRLFGEGSGETRIDMSYLKRDGGNPPEKGPFANPSSPVFEPRHNYTEAYGLGIRTPIVQSWGDYFWITSRYVGDTAYKGTLLIADAFIKPAKSWQFNLGLDLLGSGSAKSVDFLSRYQRNDRIRGGIKYVF